MAELFAALDSNGEIRFVDEVPRGAACGCRCPECASPLVAKQGVAKVWHFAHEGGQERPECAVGAANLLRRVAIDVLKAAAPLELPTFRRHLEAQRGGRSWTRTVDLESRRSSPWTWFDAPSRPAPAAQSTLADGVPVELHVEVTQPAAEGGGGTAVASFVLALPGLQELQSRIAAQEYVQRAGSVVWRYRPDPDGTFDRAAAELEREAAEASAAADAIHRQTKEAESARRAAAEAERRRVEQARNSEQTRLAASILDCTPSRAPSSSMILYRLRNKTSWLFYSLDDGGSGLVQWPPGQANVLVPPSDVATLDEHLDVYRTTPSQAIMFLAPQSAGVHNDSNPTALARWAAANLGPQ